MARAAPVVPIRFAPLACRGRPLPSSVAGRDMETCHATRWIHGGLIPPCPCGTPTEDQVRRASRTAAATLLPDLRDLPRSRPIGWPSLRQSAKPSGNRRGVCASGGGAAGCGVARGGAARASQISHENCGSTGEHCNASWRSDPSPATRRIGSRSDCVAVLASCGRSGSADRSKDSCQPSSSWVMSGCDGGAGFRLSCM
jgi:hypothetical protein